MRSALRALLEKEPDIEVVATTSNAERGRIRAQRPDVCLVDMDEPEPEALRLAQELSDEEPGQSCGLVVLLSDSKPVLLRRASEARALGFISKNASPARLLRAIRRVATGEQYVDTSLAPGFLEAAAMPLTPRELTVLSLAAEGASLPEIARRLHLSRGTVRNYMAAITRKTGARNRVDAIRISQGAGWL